MRGFITELDFEAVETSFPGIVRYYRELQLKPTTFLELLWGFTHQSQCLLEPLPLTTPSTPSYAARR